MGGNSPVEKILYIPGSILIFMLDAENRFPEMRIKSCVEDTMKLHKFPFYLKIP